jgi:hypothetical protein
MRVRVRTIEPRVDDPGLEELVVELEQPVRRRMAVGPATDPVPADPVMTDLVPTDPASAEPPTRGPGHALPIVPGTVPGGHVELVRRPLRAGDLGPNGDVVLDLLGRAGRLTPEERKALEKEAAWRWWMLTPFAGSTMPAARVRALVLGRADGRADAIVALEAAVAAIAHRFAGGKVGRSRLPAVISNAGLAVLVRDLVEPEVFEILFGPWREVMHH